MTPDERADVAERVLRESIAEFQEAAAALTNEAERIGTTPAKVMTFAAETLARNARIAGITIDERRKP